MFNCTKLVTKSVKGLTESLLTTNNVIQQQVRTTYVLERVYKFPLYKKGHLPPRMKSRNFIYKCIDNTDNHKMKSMDVILLTTIGGLGEKGDVVPVKSLTGYNELILPKKAVYASPENITKYANLNKKERTFSSLNVHFTMKYLSVMRLGIGMSPKNPWTVENWHIKVYLRKVGVHAAAEAIELPDKPISGPNFDYEGKEFYATITINNHEKVKLRCVIFHIEDPEVKTQFPKDYWKYPDKAIHPEFQEVLDSMPKAYKLMNEKKPELAEKEN